MASSATKHRRNGSPPLLNRGLQSPSELPKPPLWTLGAARNPEASHQREGSEYHGRHVHRNASSDSAALWTLRSMWRTCTRTTRHSAPKLSSTNTSTRKPIGKPKAVTRAKNGAAIPDYYLRGGGALHCPLWRKHVSTAGVRGVCSLGVCTVSRVACGVDPIVYPGKIM